jgi:O-antigen/teichoic acid export membrane protein
LHSASLIFLLTALYIQLALPAIALDQVYQAGGSFDRLNQIKLVCTTLQLLLTIAVLTAGYRIVGLASVLTITTALQLIFLFVALPSSVPSARFSLTRLRWSIVRRLVLLSRWAFLNNISAYILELFGWTILGSLGSMRDAALFGLASKLPKQLWNLVDKGASVALPSLSGHFLNNDLQSLQTGYLRSQKLVIGAVLPFIALGCFFAGPVIQVWAGTEYAQAAVVMKWLLLAALSHAILYSSDLLLYACGRVREAAWISAAGGTIGLFGSFLLVPRFGAAGMASSIAISQLLVCCTWFTVEGCRVSGVSLNALLRGVGNGLGWPTLAMSAGVVLAMSLHTVLSPLWLVICAIVSGILYLAIWGRRTALPIVRNQVEVAE